MMVDDAYPDDLPHDLQSSYDDLVSTGRTNHAVAQQVERTGRLPENGRECLLCEAPSNLTVLDEGDDWYVVDLQHMKGHDVRTLLAKKEHGVPPDDPGPYRDRLLDNTAPLMADEEKDWMGVYARHGTFSAHYHLVAFDLGGDDEAGIHDAALYRRDGATYDPDPAWIRPEEERTATGEILLYDGGP